MTMRPERCSARSRTTPSSGLPAARRFCGDSSPWSMALRIIWVKRIGDALDHRLVDLGALAFGHEAHRFAGQRRDLAHEPRHALEHRLHRLRADRHDAVLDFARQLLEFAKARRDAGRARKPGLMRLLRQHGLIDDEFADEIDEAVDAVEIDADRRDRLVGPGVIGLGRDRALAVGFRRSPRPARAAS